MIIGYDDDDYDHCYDADDGNDDVYDSYNDAADDNEDVYDGLQWVANGLSRQTDFIGTLLLQAEV